MSNNSNLVGLFELQTPADLFRKLEFDLSRLEKARTDQYAAFDVFVTAEHMLDWVYPDDPQSQKAERNARPALKICSHLANGAKHFKATAARHTSVDAAKVHHGPYSSVYSRVYDTSRPEVYLDGDAAASFGPVIDAFMLAMLVRDFWRAKLSM